MGRTPALGHSGAKSAVAARATPRPAVACGRPQFGLASRRTFSPEPSPRSRAAASAPPPRGILHRHMLACERIRRNPAPSPVPRRGSPAFPAVLSGPLDNRHPLSPRPRPPPGRGRGFAWVRDQAAHALGIHPCILSRSPGFTIVVLVAAAEDSIVAAVLTFVFWGPAPWPCFFGCSAPRPADVAACSRSEKHSNATIEPNWRRSIAAIPKTVMDGSRQRRAHAIAPGRFLQPDQRGETPGRPITPVRIEMRRIGHGAYRCRRRSAPRPQV